MNSREADIAKIIKALRKVPDDANWHNLMRAVAEQIHPYIPLGPQKPTDALWRQ